MKKRLLSAVLAVVSMCAAARAAAVWNPADYFQIERGSVTAKVPFRSTGSMTVDGTLTLNGPLASPLVPAYGGLGLDLSGYGVGSLPYFGGTGTFSILSPGGSGTYLRSAGAGAPTWGSFNDVKTSSAAHADSADVATNGVVTTGSYPDPNWIPSLAGSKVSGVFQSTTSQTVSSTTTWTGNISLAPGQVITVASGFTLTIDAVLNAGPYQIFAGAGHVVFGSHFHGTVFPEWFGAVGDNSTNDAAAIQAAINSLDPNYGGKIIFGAKSYVSGSTLTIPTTSLGHIVLEGTNQQWYGGSGSRIRSTVPNSDILQIHGKSTPTALMMVDVKNIGFGRDTTTDTAGAGISILYANSVQLTNVHIENCFTAVDSSATANLLIEKCFLTRPVSIPSGASIGIYLHESSYGNLSARIAHNIISFPVPGTSSHTGTCYGVYAYGNTLTDIFIENNDIQWADYGVYLQGTAGTVLNSQDLHVTGNIIDSFANTGVYVTGIDPQGEVSVAQNWLAPAATGSTFGVFVDSSRGVSVRGNLSYGYLNSTPGHVGYNIQNSTGCLVVGNLSHDAATSVLLTNASNNIVTANSFLGGSTRSALYGIQLVKSSSNTITGNNMSGYGTTGLGADSISFNNTWASNKIDTSHITNIEVGVNQVGDEVSCSTASASFAASTTYKDGCSIVLNDGVWSIGLNTFFYMNGGTTSVYSFGMSTTSGNSSSGLTTTDNLATQTPFAGEQRSASLVDWNLGVSAPTTVYFKMSATFTGAIPQLYGTLKARKVQ